MVAALAATADEMVVALVVEGVVAAVMLAWRQRQQRWCSSLVELRQKNMPLLVCACGEEEREEEKVNKEARLR